MRRLISAFVVLASMCLAAPASAIINGQADGDGHRNVGGLVSPRVFADGTWIYCTGTLISPNVFLTAAHCSEDGRVEVTFSAAYEDGDTTHAGVFHADPRYGRAASDPHDIAVVVLDKPVDNTTPAPLPAAGSLSNLPKDQQLTSVGYGAYEVSNGAGGKQFLYDDVRMTSTGSLNATNLALLRISQNKNTGDGGTCYGDSGGPNFLGLTQTVAAITITGDAACRATNVTYRLDTASARSFLSQFVVLP